MNESRQILFALLAHQNEFITQEQLLKAFRLWLADKSRSLETVLVEQGAISQDDRNLFDRLVEKYLERFGGDAQLSLANLSGISSVVEQLQTSAASDSDTFATVSFLHPAADQSDSATTLHGLPNTPGIRVQPGNEDRFRIVKEHAKGGLGVVFVAEDRHLKREVALKQIRQDRADDDLFRQKFLQEAEVTGQLEHPGIVPVYALGTDTNGRPYYAMRFVRGEDLQSRIRKFHKGLASKEYQYDGPELRALLRRFVDVCNAIDYAHDRGVLHRDLKPGNVMLGKHGETLVVDWGLAKPLGQKPGTDTNGNSLPGESPISQSESGDSATQHGVFLGTAAYAPPEQLKGELHRLCPASDVYSLGAILYELLCDKRPVEGKTVFEIIKNIESGTTTAPRARNSAIPKPLDSICRKALAATIQSRYQSANDLRGEIEAWLNDIPVPSHRDSILERIGRWSRKHKTLVATLSAVVLVTAIALTGLSVVQGKANRQIAEQRDQAKLLAANTLLDKGFRLASAGQITDGILHMGAALEQMPQRKTNLEEVIRNNISAWTANTQYSLGGIDIEGDASRIIAVSDDGQYAATVVGNQLGYRVIVVLQCRPVLTHVQQITLSDEVGALTFTADEKLIASSGNSLLEIDPRSGQSRALTPLPSIATAITIGSTGRIWLGCENGQLGYVETSQPKWTEVSVCQGAVITLGISQREDRIIACTAAGQVHVLDGQGKALVPPFVAGIGYSYAVDADHGYLVASAGSPANASIITFWRSNGTKIPASLTLTNSANSIELIPSRSELVTAKKDLSIDAQSVFDWHHLWNQKTPLAALTCRASRDSTLLIMNSIGKRGTWVSAVDPATADPSVAQTSFEEPICSCSLGDVSLWGGNTRPRNGQASTPAMVDVYSNSLAKILTSLPINHPVSQIHHYQDRVLLVGATGITLLDDDLNLTRAVEQDFPIARRGAIRDIEANSGVLISNIMLSKELRSFDLSSLHSVTGPATDGWLCYGFASAPKHDMFLLGLHDGTIRALDNNGQEKGQTLLPTDAEIFDLAVDSKQTRVVAITRSGAIFAYSLPNLELLSQVDATDGKYPTTRFSSDDRWLLTGFGESQLRDSLSMLPIGPPKGCPNGPYGEKTDCFFGNGFATASVAATGVGYIQWFPYDSGWKAPKDQTQTLLSRRLGSPRRTDGNATDDTSPLTHQELQNWFPNPDMPLPTSKTFRSWQVLREKYGKWHFDPRNEALASSRAHQTTQQNPSTNSPSTESKLLNAPIGHQLVQLDASKPTQLGSPLSELGRLPNETYHERSLKLKLIAVGTHEVSVEQFSAFRPTYSSANSESTQLPATQVSWYDAAAYCNWLSEQEGLGKEHWCYMPNSLGEYGPGMKIASDWWKRKGYRLPTEFEWEFACRAGTLTARPGGDALDNIDDWCWTSHNSQGKLHPIGLKLNNGFGIYDMLGNASEWCHTSHEIIPTFGGEPSVVGEFPGPVYNTKPRSVRGGSALEFHGNSRSSFRDYYTPDTRLPCLGFRICRTIDSSVDTNGNLPADELLPFVGEYKYGTSILTTTIENGQLFAQLTGQPKYPIYPAGKNTFRWRVIDAQVEFVENEQGIVTKARHTQDGTTFDAPKVK